MFALFNAIYWTHVKMAAASGRSELAKNLGPGESELEWKNLIPWETIFVTKVKIEGK